MDRHETAAADIARLGIGHGERERDRRGRVDSVAALLEDLLGRVGAELIRDRAGFAQFEREMMLERQREGIAKAKAENRYIGLRPSARLKADEAVKLFKAGRTVTEIATALSIGRGSVYRALEAAGTIATHPVANRHERSSGLRRHTTSTRLPPLSKQSNPS